MSLFSVFNVTGSAMSAESVRLNTTSSNLANAIVLVVQRKILTKLVMQYLAQS